MCAARFHASQWIVNGAARRCGISGRYDSRAGAFTFRSLPRINFAASVRSRPLSSQSRGFLVPLSFPLRRTLRIRGPLYRSRGETACAGSRSASATSTGARTEGDRGARCRPPSSSSTMASVWNRSGSCCGPTTCRSPSTAASAPSRLISLTSKLPSQPIATAASNWKSPPIRTKSRCVSEPCRRQSASAELKLSLNDRGSAYWRLAAPG